MGSPFYLSGSAYLRRNQDPCDFNWAEDAPLPSTQMQRRGVDDVCLKKRLDPVLKKHGWGPIVSYQDPLKETCFDLDKLVDDTIFPTQKRRRGCEDINLLIEIANTRLTPKLHRIWVAERKAWHKILMCYSHLDIKNKGYVDVRDCTTHLKEMLTKSTHSTQRLPLQDILLSILQHLAPYVSHRGVVEKPVVCCVLKGWLDAVRVQNKNTVPMWLQLFASDDPDVNALLKAGFHDSARDAFYQTPKQVQPHQRTVLTTKHTKKSPCSKGMEMPQLTSYTAPLDLYCGDPIGGHVDEVLRFQNPIFQSCEQRCPFERERINRWDVDVSRLACAFPTEPSPSKVLLVPVPTRHCSSSSL
eukprot:Blabericola_migrator_1__7500@NODE_382_length_9143_cov_306_926399_g305_i0_p3_GENE_NODE_382_length_9143_cov_306_926399_g305_i0NODE_382_length_9143_cov_306_926399_g305_i0_p3_ORF_typecomplete_len357_score58_49TP6A_N/PF04406_14/33TP6A_N/PF04406_14/3_3FeldI_B/PF09252_10/0_29_NODE_382_length_9143_cov_306_926399_g305_i078908960